MKVKQPESFAFRANKTKWEREHVPLDTQIGRNYWKARTKNRAAEPYRYQAELNAGKAQVNAPENYMFSKKEW